MDINKWEKSITRILNSFVENPVDNLNSISVDTYKTNYGIIIKITFLMNSPFNKESDYLLSLRNSISNVLKTFLSPFETGTYSISFGIETVENYNNISKPYYEKMKNNIIESSSLRSTISRILLEASKVKILTDKLGFTEEIAQSLENVCGSLSVWMGNKLIDHQLQIAKSWDKEITKKDSVDKLNKSSFRALLPKVVQIMDWVRVGLNSDIKQYKNLTIEELYSKSYEWHQSLKIGGGQINYVEENPIILDFRDSDGVGFYWVDLETNDSSEECNRMGHCGRTASENTIYSLRETKKLNDKFTINKSHLTSSISDDGGILIQLKGPKNSKPKPEFHKYIIPLLELKSDGDFFIKNFGSEYQSSSDFKIKDLSEDEIRSLYNSRPDLFQNRNERKLLFQLGILEKDPIDYKFTWKIDSDEIGRFVNNDWVFSRRKDKHGRTVETTIIETILSGDNWELWDNHDSDWKLGLMYNVDKENESKILEILKKFAESNGESIDENMGLEDLIEEYDEDHEIRSAIQSSISDAESSDYVNHLYDEVKSTLSHWGNVTELTDEGAVIEVNAEPFFDEVDSDSVDETLDNFNDDVISTFIELILQGDIEKPRFDLDDRYYPDIDDSYFNDMLSDRLGDI
jgi:hypothetical protein